MLISGCGLIGRRKCSVAVVHLTPQKGGVTVNSEPLLSYFPLPEQRQQILYPLITTDLLNDVTINALVRGGGKTGRPISLYNDVMMM